MTTVGVETNAADVAKLFDVAGKSILGQAHALAVNKTMELARREIRNDIKRNANVPAGSIKKRFKLHRAKVKRPQARLFVGTMPVPLNQLKYKQLAGGGISYSGANGRRARAPTSAFVARMPSGHEGVFQRRGSRRLPIDAVKVAIHPAALKSARKVLKQMPKHFRQQYTTTISEKMRAQASKLGLLRTG